MTSMRSDDTNPARVLLLGGTSEIGLAILSALKLPAGTEVILAGRDGQRILIVSHVTPIKTLLCRALLAPPAAMYRMHLDTASLSKIEWFADGPAVVRLMNDVSHLQDHDKVPKKRRRGQRDRAQTPS